MLLMTLLLREMLIQIRQILRQITPMQITQMMMELLRLMKMILLKERQRMVPTIHHLRVQPILVKMKPLKEGQHFQRRVEQPEISSVSSVSDL